MIRNLFLFLFAVLLTSCTSAAGVKDKKSPYTFPSLNSLKGASVSGYVVDVNSGYVLAAKDQDLRMTPASLSKIFTTSAALALLGPEFRYQTVIARKGKVVNGLLKGDLLVIGGGDPTLGSKYFSSTHPDSVFAKIFHSLKKAGIRTVTGRLVIVTGYFSAPAYPSLRLWEDMSNYYGAPPASLSFMDNTFRVYLRSPSKTGEKCKITNIVPDVGLKMDCRVVSAPSNKDSAYIYGFPGLKEWYIDGSIPAGRNRFAVKGAMPFPEKVFAGMLTSYLKRNGIKINGISFEHSPAKVITDTLGVVYSPPLSSIVKVVNKRSVNLFADHIFLTLAKKTGKADWDNARLVFDEFWKEKTGENDIHFHDGSGLSPFNSFTPVDMIKALRFNAQSSIAEEFKASLAVSGVDGTLKRMWDSDQTKRHVIGKSGYMQGVLGYAGYITTSKGRQLAFCIMVNHFTKPVSHVRALIEEEIEKIIIEN